jgi:DNA-binding FadR family transcriptional regulator
LVPGSPHAARDRPCPSGRRNPEGDLELIEKALEDNRRAIDNLAAFVATDVPFHYVLPTISGNPIFKALHRAMSGWMIEVRNVTMQVPGSTERAYQAHKRIYQAIATGNPDAAAKAMRDHLEEVDRQYWNAVTGRTGARGEKARIADGPITSRRSTPQRRPATTAA